MITIKRSVAGAIALLILLAACSRYDTHSPETQGDGFQPAETFTIASKTVLVKQTRSISNQQSTAASPTPMDDPMSAMPESVYEIPSKSDEVNQSEDHIGNQQADSPSEPISGEGKLIDYFMVEPATADPGQSVTLKWQTTSAITVTVWHLMPTGQMGEFWPASAAGALSYSISLQERNRSTFALTAQGEEGVLETATTAVTLRCTGSWFFDSAPDICPAEPPLLSTAAVQGFENGTMIWVEKEDLIYVLFDDASSPRWTVYPDSWNEGQPEENPALTPPPGLVQPVRGFGLIWRSQPGVSDRLGWALSLEAGYETVVQRTSYAKYNHTYIRAPDGDIWHLGPESSRWNKEAPSAG